MADAIAPTETAIENNNSELVINHEAHQKDESVIQSNESAEENNACSDSAKNIEEISVENAGTATTTSTVNQ